MTAYACGHVTNGVILLNSNMLSLCAYFHWAETVGIDNGCVQCWDCYCKESEGVVVVG